MKNLLLVRHPEAIKNIEDRHGGLGSELTPNGINQTKILAQHFAHKFQEPKAAKLYGSNRPKHVQQTLQLLSQYLEINPCWENDLRGLDMGVLAGLSRKEAAVQYPDLAFRLEKWRSNNLRVDKLNIPNGETIQDFRCRIDKVLNIWQQEDCDTIVAICTRSLLIMMVNIALLGEDFNYNSYRSIDFHSASITTIQMSQSKSLSLDTLDSRKHLDEEIYSSNVPDK